MVLINSALLTFHPFISRDNRSAFMINLGVMDFQADPDYQFQVQAAIPLQRLAFQVQSVYMDASEVTTGLTTITVGTTNQRISIPAGKQGYLPLICNPGSQVFTFSNPDAFAAATPQVLRAILTNTAVVGVQWDVTP